MCKTRPLTTVSETAKLPDQPDQLTRLDRLARPSRHDRRFWHHRPHRSLSRRGFGTLEIVIIIAVLLTIALIFRQTLTSYANDLISSVFKSSIISDLNDDNA